MASGSAKPLEHEPLERDPLGPRDLLSASLWPARIGMWAYGHWYAGPKRCWLAPPRVSVGFVLRFLELCIDFARDRPRYDLP